MRVLVPTDFSADDLNTIDKVTQILSESLCTFILLHTYEIPTASTNEIISINDKLKEEANIKLVKLKKQLESLHSNKKHNFTTMAVHGDFIRVVKRIFKEEKIDLISITSCDKYYPDSLLHYGYAKVILESLKCPILAIPVQTS